MAMGSGTSGAGAHGAARWCIPSSVDLMFIAFVGILAFTSLSVRLLSDAGIGWHIRCGQLILATHTVPRVDPFSSTMHGQRWFAWEWLFDIVVGWLDRVGGLNAVVLFAALIISGVYAWTFRLLLRLRTNLFVALILTLLAASAAMLHLQARPHVLSWLFSLVWFCILESSDAQLDQRQSSTRDRLLWFLPLLMLIWVNVHGGFPTGFVLLVIYWIGAAWEYLASSQDRFEDILRTIHAGRRLRSLTLIGLVSAAVTLINPYFFNLHIHIYRYLSNRFLMDHIDEFQSPNFHYAAQKCFAVLLLLTMVALAARCRNIGSSHILILLFAVFSGLYASRNIPVSSLLLVLVIGPWLTEAIESCAEKRAIRDGSIVSDHSPVNFFARMQAVEFSLRGHLWPLAVVVLSCYVAANGGALGSKRFMDAHFDPKRFPVQAVSFLEKHLEKHDVHGPLLAPDYWGGYLIYRFYPKAQVVIDDRHDLYGDRILNSYLRMIHVEEGWRDFLEQHPAEYILVPKGSALNNILLENSKWRVMYSDDTTSVFRPSGTP
jgi:hypothetical protein